VNKLNQTMDDQIHSVIQEISKQKDAILMTSLKELVDKGLLVVEQTEGVLVTSPADPYKFEFRQSVRLVLRDKEYIKELESKVKHLEEKIGTLQSIMEKW
jgi:hypothetical protein